MDMKWLERTLVYVALGASVVACGSEDEKPRTGADGGADGAVETDGSAAPDGDASNQGSDASDEEQDGEAGEPGPECDGTVDCGSGWCDVSSGDLLCICDAGYEGEACDECADGHEGADCGTCSEGYIPSGVFPRTCIQDPCADVDCGFYGDCVVLEDTAVCDCENGWTGELCDECAEGYEGDTCATCSDGYQSASQFEPLCVADACIDTDCGNGTCSFDGADAVCDCTTGWAGEACDSCELGYVQKQDDCVLELPVQGRRLQLWLDATENVSNTRAGVSAWQSRVREINAVQGDASFRPDIVTAGGATFLHFDGEDDHLVIGSLLLDSPTYSLFIAARPSKTAGVQGFVGGVDPDKPNNHGLIVRSQNGAGRVQYAHRAPFSLTGTDGSIAADGFPTDGLPQPFQIVTVERRNGDEGLMQVIRGGSNEQTFPTDEPAFEDAMRLILGSRTEASDPLDGDIGEILLYEGALDEDERAAVEAYLKARWKLGPLVLIPVIGKL